MHKTNWRSHKIMPLSIIVRISISPVSRVKQARLPDLFSRPASRAHKKGYGARVEGPQPLHTRPISFFMRDKASRVLAEAQRNLNHSAFDLSSCLQTQRRIVYK